MYPLISLLLLECLEVKLERLMLRLLIQELELQLQHTNGTLIMDGTIDASTTSPAYTYTFPAFGTYTSCLTVVGTNGFISCTDVACRTVNVEFMVVDPKFRVAPNPTKGRTNVFVELESDESNVEIDVFNSLGNKVDNIYSGPMTKGKKRLKWDPKANTPSGVYYLKLHSHSGVATQKNSVAAIRFEN